jgi:hypothetical protein
MVRQKESTPTIGIICAASALMPLSTQAPAMWSFVIAKKGAEAPVYYFFVVVAFGSTGAGIKAQASAASWR